MPRSLMAITKAQGSKTPTGPPAQTIASAKTGLASKKGLRGGGVRGSADRVKN